LNTEIAIPPAYWDKQKECIKESLPEEYGHQEKLNDEIDSPIKLACDLIKLAKRQGIAEIGAYVKEKFSPGLKLNQITQEDFNLKSAYVPEIKKKKEGFFKHWEDYVNAKKKRVKPATITAYNNAVGHFAGIVFVKQRPGTAKGVCFMTLEDETGEANVVVFENLFNLYRREIMQSELIMIEGKLQKESNVIHVITQVCYDFSKLVRRLALPKEKNHSKANQEKLFPDSRNFR
jgi:DNA polymerase III alpha subunit